MLEIIFDLDKKNLRLEELDSIISEPGFWDDNVQAQIVLKEQSQIKNSLKEYDDLNKELEESVLLYEMAIEENDDSTAQEAKKMLFNLEKRLERLEFLRMMGGEDDSKNAILSINAGAGGTEAQDWAEMLLRMYLRYSERSGFKSEVVDIQDGDEAGIKSATILVSGDYSYGYLKAENGVHRLVRISPFDANKRRHTSFASVFVLPEIDDSIDVKIDDKDLRIDTFRSSGKGGQHVNKTDSAIRITHLPTGIVVSCQNQRSQHQNKDSALKILKARLYELERSKKQEEMQEVHSSKKEIGWGSQIRSYIMHPYRMVKDHRTEFESSNVDSVLDGDIDEFIKSYLSYQSIENSS